MLGHPSTTQPTAYSTQRLEEEALARREALLRRQISLAKVKALQTEEAEEDEAPAQKPAPDEKSPAYWRDYASTLQSRLDHLHTHSPAWKAAQEQRLQEEAAEAARRKALLQREAVLKKQQAKQAEAQKERERAERNLQAQAQLARAQEEERKAALLARAQEKEKRDKLAAQAAQRKKQQLEKEKDSTTAESNKAEASGPLASSSSTSIRQQDQAAPVISVQDDEGRSASHTNLSSSDEPAEAREITLTEEEEREVALLKALAQRKTLAETWNAQKEAQLADLRDMGFNVDSWFASMLSYACRRADPYRSGTLPASEFFAILACEFIGLDLSPEAFAGLRRAILGTEPPQPSSDDGSAPQNTDDLALAGDIAYDAWAGVIAGYVQEIYQEESRVLDGDWAHMYDPYSGLTFYCNKYSQAIQFPRPLGFTTHHSGGGNGSGGSGADVNPQEDSIKQKRAAPVAVAPQMQHVYECIQRAMMSLDLDGTGLVEEDLFWLHLQSSFLGLNILPDDIVALQAYIFPNPDGFVDYVETSAKVPAFLAAAIAERGLESTYGWCDMYHPSVGIFFYNKVTQETQGRRPSAYFPDFHHFLLEDVLLDMFLQADAAQQGYIAEDTFYQVLEMPPPSGLAMEDQDTFALMQAYPNHTEGYMVYYNFVPVARALMSSVFQQRPPSDEDWILLESRAFASAFWFNRRSGVLRFADPFATGEEGEEEWRLLPSGPAATFTLTPHTPPHSAKSSRSKVSFMSTEGEREKGDKDSPKHAETAKDDQAEDRPHPRLHSPDLTHKQDSEDVSLSVPSNALLPAISLEEINEIPSDEEILDETELANAKPQKAKQPSLAPTAAAAAAAAQSQVSASSSTTPKSTRASPKAGPSSPPSQSKKRATSPQATPPHTRKPLSASSTRSSGQKPQSKPSPSSSVSSLSGAPTGAATAVTASAQKTPAPPSSAKSSRPASTRSTVSTRRASSPKGQQAPVQRESSESSLRASSPKQPPAAQADAGVPAAEKQEDTTARPYSARHHKAATKIQARYRGHRTRTSLRKDRNVLLPPEKPRSSLEEKHAPGSEQGQESTQEHAQIHARMQFYDISEKDFNAEAVRGELEDLLHVPKEEIQVGAPQQVSSEKDTLEVPISINYPKEEEKEVIESLELAASHPKFRQRLQDAASRENLAADYEKEAGQLGEELPPKADTPPPSDEAREVARRHAAATKIQASYRGYRVRKSKSSSGRKSAAAKNDAVPVAPSNSETPASAQLSAILSDSRPSVRLRFADLDYDTVAGDPTEAFFFKAELLGSLASEGVSIESIDPGRDITLVRGSVIAVVHTDMDTILSIAGVASNIRVRNCAAQLITAEDEAAGSGKRPSHSARSTRSAKTAAASPHADAVQDPRPSEPAPADAPPSPRPEAPKKQQNAQLSAYADLTTTYLTTVNLFATPLVLEASESTTTKGDSKPAHEAKADATSADATSGAESVPAGANTKEGPRTYGDNHQRAAVKIQASYRGHRTRKQIKANRKAAEQASAPAPVVAVNPEPSESSDADPQQDPQAQSAGDDGKTVAEHLEQGPPPPEAHDSGPSAPSEIEAQAPAQEESVARDDALASARYDERHEKAATKIQARYRGYRVRKTSAVPVAKRTAVVAPAVGGAANEEGAAASTQESPAKDQDSGAVEAAEVVGEETAREPSPAQAAAPTEPPDVTEPAKPAEPEPEPEPEPKAGPEPEAETVAETSTDGDSHRRREAAAVKIQAQYRGYRVRKQAKARGAKATPQSEVVKEDVTPTEEGGTREVGAPKEEEKAATENVANDDDTKRKAAAATKIQASYRGYRTRKQLKSQKVTASPAPVSAAPVHIVAVEEEAETDKPSEEQAQAPNSAPVSSAANLDASSTPASRASSARRASGLGASQANLAVASAEPHDSGAIRPVSARSTKQLSRPASSRSARPSSARVKSARASQTSLHQAPQTLVSDQQPAQQDSRRSSRRGSVTAAAVADDEKSYISESSRDSAEEGEEDPAPQEVDAREAVLPPPVPPRSNAPEEESASHTAPESGKGDAKEPEYLEPTPIQPPAYEVIDDPPQSPPYQKVVGEDLPTPVQHVSSPTPPASTPPSSRGASARRRSLPSVPAASEGHGEKPKPAEEKKTQVVVRRQLSPADIAHLQKSGRRVVNHSSSNA